MPFNLLENLVQLLVFCCEVCSMMILLLLIVCNLISRLAQLFARLDEVKSSGNMIVNDCE